MIRDDIIFTHHPVRRMLMAANVHTRSHIAAKLRAFINQLGNSSGLVASQRIHWIDDKSLDSFFSPVLITILQDRIKEAFRLTGAGAGSDQSRSPIISGQSFKCRLLMNVRQILRMNGFETVRHLLRPPKRKAHGYIRLMIDRILGLQHLPNRTPERLICHGECGFDIIPDAFFQLLGKYGW